MTDTIDMLSVWRLGEFAESLSNLADESQRHYLKDMLRVARYFYDKGIEPAEITHGLVFKMDADFRRAELGWATRSRQLVVMRRYWRWARHTAEPPLENDPMRDRLENDIQAQRAAKPVKRWFSASDVQRMRAVIGEATTDDLLRARNVAVFDIIYYGALRAKEAMHLHVADLRLDAEQPHIVIQRGKGAKGREVPLPVEAHAAVNAWLDTRGEFAANSYIPVAPHLFISILGTALSDKTIRQIVRKATLPSGLPVRPHDLRRSRADHLADQGMQTHELKVLLGHESILTTDSYIRDDTKRMMAAVHARSA